MTKRNRLLVVVLPGADSNAVNHLIDAHRLPHMERCIERGATAPLDWSCVAPYTADILTLMTGVPPHRHGAVTTSAPRIDGYGPTPLDRSHLKVRPLWEEWASQHHTVAAINWPASLGTQNTDAHVIADSFFHLEGLDLAASKWTVFPQSVHPASDIQHIKALRVHPTDLAQIMSDSPLAPFMPEPIDTPASRAAVNISRLASVLAVSQYYLAQDMDAVVINLDILDHVGLPTSKEVANTILDYYALVDAALGQLLEVTSEDHQIAMIMRPPSAALQQPGSQMTGNGQAVFVSTAHEPDSLLQSMIPTEICPHLHTMMGVSYEDPAEPPIDESYPIESVEPDGDLKARLAKNRPEPSAILNSTKAEHLKTLIIMEAEHLRSLTKDKDADAALKLLSQRPSTFGGLEVLYMNIAERLIRDGKPQDARAFLDRSLEDKQALAWQHFLRANIFLLEQNIAGANQQLKIASDLDPANQQIAALMENLSKLRAQT